jgi:two-component system response regulator
VLTRHNLANHFVWVRDGAEALDLIFGSSADPAAPINRAPKLVLLDLKLPKVDGHEVLRRLKSDPRTRTIPVVVLTSSREEADLLRAYETGTNSFVVKPVDFDSFAEAVRQLGLYWLLLNQAPAAVQP